VKNLDSATRSYGRLAGWLADKIALNLEIFKVMYQMKYSTFAMSFHLLI